MGPNNVFVYLNLSYGTIPPKQLQKAPKHRTSLVPPLTIFLKHQMDTLTSVALDHPAPCPVGKQMDKYGFLHAKDSFL